MNDFSHSHDLVIVDDHTFDSPYWQTFCLQTSYFLLYKVESVETSSLKRFSYPLKSESLKGDFINEYFIAQKYLSNIYKMSN